MPAGGYSSGATPGIVIRVRLATSAGRPPSLGSKKPVSPTPSGPSSGAFGSATAMSLKICTALLAVMPV